MKKYELTNNSKTVLGKKLFQIFALVDFGDVKAGSLGGYIEKEENLSQGGESWVYGDAMVFDDARVCGNALVHGNAMIHDYAKVYGYANVCGGAEVKGCTYIYGNALVYGRAKICGNTKVFGSANVANDARITSDADLLQITGLGSVHRTTTVYRTRNGIEIICGCFCGDLEQFRKQVVETRKGKVRDEYLKFAELIEIYFRL